MRPERKTPSDERTIKERASGENVLCASATRSSSARINALMSSGARPVPQFDREKVEKKPILTPP